VIRPWRGMIDKGVREGSEACFNDPFTPEHFWHLKRFICTGIIAFWITLRFGKDAKGLFTVIERLRSISRSTSVDS
jgi:hypothetical protein